MKKLIISIILQFIVAGTMMQANAQPSSYNDVFIVINDSSAVSDSIGTYFAAKHNVPSQNIAHITAPTTEEIDSAQFEDLRSQIENILTTRNLKDSINYIVTTKGVPLKVNRGDIGDLQSPSSSVESELTLILGPYASYIGKPASFNNPMQANPLMVSFQRSTYGIYLVTRLDGYTFNDVKGIIDRASTTDTLPSASKFVFDQDPIRNARMPELNSRMTAAAQNLIGKGYQAINDSSTVFLTNQNNVLGYVSWGSNDQNKNQYGDPHDTFAPRAIGETYVSTSGRSFTQPAIYGQSLIADLIAEGITGVKGYVYEPYTGAMANVAVLFDYYSKGFNLAESYYQASAYLSWMDVIIGDPKCLLGKYPTTVDTSFGFPLPVEMTSFAATSTRNGAVLVWKTATEKNNFGFNIERRTVGTTVWSKIGFVAGHGTSNIAHSYSYADANVAAGTYAYRIDQVDNNGSVTSSQEAQVTVGAAAKVLSVSNYPNPFNPTTRFEFTVPNDGMTTVKVYNVLGQEVLTVFNGEVKAGEFQHATFNGSRFSSGVYFYAIENNGQKMIKRMLMLK